MIHYIAYTVYYLIHFLVIICLAKIELRSQIDFDLERLIAHNLFRRYESMDSDQPLLSNYFLLTTISNVFFSEIGRRIFVMFFILGAGTLFYQWKKNG